MYDNDVTTWSPQGRLFQVEYAQEAVKQGSVSVGICNKDYVVLAALKRSLGDLAAGHQKKLFKVDDHIGVSIAGLTSDARVLTKYMQGQALTSRMNMNRAIPVQRLVINISDRAQINTQRYGGRPFGVGMLVAGCDETGPHLWEFSPSGNCLEYRAMAIGARSQSAKTYLEKHIDTIEALGRDELIHHALLAIRDTLPIGSATLSPSAVSIGIVGRDQDFVVIDEEEQVKAFLDKLPPAPVSSSSAGNEEVVDATESSVDQQQTQTGQSQGEGNGMDVEQP